MTPCKNNEDSWAAATFEGARIAQVREWKELSVEERFSWLCEMSEIAHDLALATGCTPPALNRERWQVSAGSQSIE